MLFANGLRRFLIAAIFDFFVAFLYFFFFRCFIIFRADYFRGI